MTDKPDLDAIEARCNAALVNPFGNVKRARALLERDIPALIAECRRLGAQCEELTHKWIKQDGPQSERVSSND